MAITEAEQKQESLAEYPSTQKRILIMLAGYLAVFLISLASHPFPYHTPHTNQKPQDQNIISTAIPKITDEFHSLSDIGWYGSAYVLTMCSFQLLVGKICKYYPAKPIFLSSILLFEIGSAICGAAPSSDVFIFGRALAGLGASGLYSSLMVIMFHTVPVQQRPIYQGFFGAVTTIASVVGPLLGGTFTDKVSWRWCFYVNLPIGAVTIAILILILHLPNQKLDPRASGFVGKLKQLDPFGNLVFFPGMVCLILALQWGGTQYSWKNFRIILLLVLCGVLCLSFAAIQIWKKEDATVPPRLVKQRSIAAAMWFGFFNFGAMMVFLYYLPIWFQAVKGVSAVKSGIMLLPLIISATITTLASGFFISKIGYYNPLLILSTIVTSIGAGLFTTFTPATSHAKWIGCQVLFGAGLGFGAQGPMNIAQTVLDRSDVATGMAAVMFFRFLGSAICLPIAQNVFLGQLVSRMKNLPGISPNDVINGGATDIRLLATGDELDVLLGDYNAAIVCVFYMVTAACCLTVVGSLAAEWRSLKARASEQKGGDKVEGSKESEMDV
jgi:MFS family permease